MPHSKKLLARLKLVSQIHDLEFEAPYSGDIAKRNKVLSYAAELFTNRGKLSYFYHLFEKLGVNIEDEDQDTNNPGIITRCSKMPFVNIDQIIIKDESTLRLFYDSMNGEFKKEQELFIAAPNPPLYVPFPLSSEANTNVTGEKQCNAAITIVRSILLSVAFSGGCINFEKLIRTIRADFSHLANMPFKEIGSYSKDSHVKQFVCFLRGLLKNPLKTNILTSPYIRDLGIPPVMLATAAKLFLDNELLSEKPIAISLQAFILSTLKGRKAADGECYTHTYTEIQLFSDALFVPQADGSMLICFKNTQSYKQFYATGKRFEGKLDIELKHLFDKAEIQASPINGSFEHDCVLSVGSVRDLASKGVVFCAGLFNHEQIANKSIFSSYLYDYEKLKFWFNDEKLKISSIPAALFGQSFLSDKEKKSVTNKDLANAFGFNPHWIIDLKVNMREETLEVQTTNSQAASSISNKIGTMLAEIDDCNYEKQIKLDLINNSIIAVSGNAFLALKNMLRRYQDEMVTYKTQIKTSSKK